jgi:hypothetical protein
MASTLHRREGWQSFFSFERRFSMSAQIIQLSDYRKVRPAAMPRLMSLSLSIFVAYLVIGAAIHEAIIEAAQFRR